MNLQEDTPFTVNSSYQPDALSPSPSSLSPLAMPDNLENNYATSPLATTSKSDFQLLKPRVRHYYPPEVLKYHRPMEELLEKNPDDIIAF